VWEEWACPERAARLAAGFRWREGLKEGGKGGRGSSVSIIAVHPFNHQPPEGSRKKKTKSIDVLGPLVERCVYRNRSFSIRK